VDEFVTERQFFLIGNGFHNQFVGPDVNAHSRRELGALIERVINAERGTYTLDLESAVIGVADGGMMQTYPMVRQVKLAFSRAADVEMVALEPLLLTDRLSALVAGYVDKQAANHER
jgi:hypothetical protein